MMDVSDVEWLYMLCHTPWWSFGDEQDVDEDWQEAAEEDREQSMW